MRRLFKRGCVGQRTQAYGSKASVRIVALECCGAVPRVQSQLPVMIWLGLGASLDLADDEPL